MRMTSQSLTRRKRIVRQTPSTSIHNCLRVDFHSNKRYSLAKITADAWWWPAVVEDASSTSPVISSPHRLLCFHFTAPDRPHGVRAAFL